jgi:hypothetical protein
MLKTYCCAANPDPNVTTSPGRVRPKNGGVPVPFQLIVSTPPTTLTLKTVVASNPVAIVLGPQVTSSSTTFGFSYQTLSLNLRMTLYSPWLRGENGEESIRVSPSETDEVAENAPAMTMVPVSITDRGFEMLKDNPSGDTPVTKNVPLFPGLTRPEMVIKSPIERPTKLVFPTGAGAGGALAGTVMVAGLLSVTAPVNAIKLPFTIPPNVSVMLA